jgi:GTPase SAR1 family protein
VGGRIDIRGVYRFSSIVKQKIKGENYAVFCFAEKRIFFLFL